MTQTTIHGEKLIYTSCRTSNIILAAVFCKMAIIFIWLRKLILQSY